MKSRQRVQGSGFRVQTPNPFPSAYQIARFTCQQWGVRQFEREMEEHLQRGFVVALPTMFLMAKAVELNPEPGTLNPPRKAWLITHAIGNLQRLVSFLPWPLEWIAFRRRGDRRLRIYKMDRFLEIAMRLPSPAPARDRARNSIRGSLDHKHDHEYEHEVKKL